MPDAYGDRTDDVGSPARSARSVTPADGADLADVPKGLYVGTGGTVVLIGAADSVSTTWQNVPNGTILPIRARRVLATGTTASGLLALY